MPLVTILAREMRLKVFEVDQRLAMLRVLLVTQYWCEKTRLKFFEVDQALEMFASAASHDIGARNAIEIFLKSTKLWRCCECR